MVVAQALLPFVTRGPLRCAPTRVFFCDLRVGGKVVAKAKKGHAAAGQCPAFVIQKGVGRGCSSSPLVSRSFRFGGRPPDELPWAVRFLDVICGKHAMDAASSGYTGME